MVDKEVANLSDSDTENFANVSRNWRTVYKLIMTSAWRELLIAHLSKITSQSFESNTNLFFRLVGDWKTQECTVSVDPSL